MFQINKISVKIHHIRRNLVLYLSTNTSTQKKPPIIKPNASGSPVTWTSLGLMGLVGSGLLIFYLLEKERKVQNVTSEIKNVGKPALGGPWVLVNQHGVPVTDATYKGKYTLLYFGFTYCPDICPSELVKVGKIMDELEKRKIQSLKPLFISVDPARDTIGQLRYYSKDFHPSMDYLTGTKDQVAVASRAFRVYFSKADEHEEDEDDYLVDHSIVLYLCGPDGEFLEFFTQRTLVSDIVDKICDKMKAASVSK